jgi:ribonucleotide monophosphatase NagD (HAD superfamily)
MPGSSHRRAAIAFDIDGVFKYGREWAEAGLSSLRKASEAKIPYVFVTNGGGGLTEEVYGAHLKEKVLAAGGGSSGDIELPSAERMILSYTPWESQLVPGLVDKRVLLVGDPAEKVKEVAATYGLKHAVHYSDYAKAHPSINPFRVAREAGTSHTAVANTTVVKMTAKPAAKDAAEEPFAAILVMCDPYEWYEALQISIDVLCSPTPLSLEFDPTAAPMPIHFSNPDFLSKFEHPFPRFAQVRARLRAARVRRACMRACSLQPACAACIRCVGRVRQRACSDQACMRRRTRSVHAACVQRACTAPAVHTRPSERGLPCILMRRGPSRWLSWRCTRRGCVRCVCPRRASASGSAPRSASGASPPPRAA